MYLTRFYTILSIAISESSDTYICRKEKKWTTKVYLSSLSHFIKLKSSTVYMKNPVDVVFGVAVKFLMWF